MHSKIYIPKQFKVTYNLIRMEYILILLCYNLRNIAKVASLFPCCCHNSSYGHSGGSTGGAVGARAPLPPENP